MVGQGLVATMITEIAVRVPPHCILPTFVTELGLSPFSMNVSVDARGGESANGCLIEGLLNVSTTFLRSLASKSSDIMSTYDSWIHTDSLIALEGARMASMAFKLGQRGATVRYPLRPRCRN